jgi:hypothetical protein
MIDTTVDQTYKGHPTRPGCVPDGRFTAGGIPAKHSRVREPHACELFQAPFELELARRRLEDVRAAILAENLVGSLEEMRERLAVVAITNTSIPTLWRGITQRATQCTT